jgi:ELWxxDGT repeat protein
MKKITFLVAIISVCCSGLFAQTPAGLTELTGDGVVVTAVNNENISTNNKRMIVVGSKIFFTAQTTAAGEELWVSDGTSSGTKMVKDVVSGSNGSNPQWLCAVGNKCYFTATTTTQGTELWVSDGTDAGTTLVKDIYSGTGSSSPFLLTSFGTKVLFFALDTDSELLPVVDATKAERWLWISDGTTAGTIRIGDTPTKETGYDGIHGKIIVTKDLSKAFFIGYSADYNETLWITDGTQTGTKPIKDINSRTISGSFAKTAPAAIDWMTPMGNKIVFRAETVSEVTKNTSLGLNGDIGSEIWVSDGTAAGTNWIGVDFASGMTGAAPKPTQFAWTLPINDNLLVFRADDGVHSIEPCVMDISKPFVDLTNPKIVFDYNNWSFPSSVQPSWPQCWRTVHNGYVYFQANGWIWEPPTFTAKGGTGQSLTRINVSSGDISKIDSITACRQWTTDNYTIFTPNGNSDNSNYFTEVGGSLFFTAEDATNNNELWYLDASDYPRKYSDFTGNGIPHSLRAMNNKLYFVATETNRLYQVSTTTGITNPKTINLRVFPNPVTDFINIQTVESIKSVDLYNVQGCRMMSVSGNNKKINISTLNNGIYFVNIKLNSGEIAIEKVVKR